MAQLNQEVLKMDDSIINEMNNLRLTFDSSLILNPTENIPWEFSNELSFTEGLYIPEDSRDKESKVCFGGRSHLRDVMTNLYKSWENVLGAKASSFKLYSGLHAHIILFMALGNIGDKVMIIPESAGGHYATAQILRRLGLKVKECVPDYTHFCVDVPKTKELIVSWQPNFIFVDRSDGLYYEDFSWMNEYTNIYKVFDASQYLSHIIAGDYKNPFDMGMDLILTTLHKNYPGPQKAAFFTKSHNKMWEQIESGLTAYVSNTHPLDIFKAVLTLPNIDIIRDYSQKILQNSFALEKSLSSYGVPVIKRDPTKLATQQIWLPVPNDDFGYQLFKRLEQMSLLTNYRSLPYHLGRGLRFGTAAATRQGLTPDSADSIGQLIAEAYSSETINKELIHRAVNTIMEIKNNVSY